jgi:hypothetical protein
MNGEMTGIDLRPAIDEQRDDDHRDHEERQPCRSEVAAVKATVAVLARRRILDANDGEDYERHQHGGREEILGEGQPVTTTNPRDMKVAVEQRTVGLDDGGHQDRETPHRKKVREPGHGPTQNLALARHFGDLRLADLAETLPTSRGLLSAADEP